jgi:LysR family transcriptional regulator, glycine cleavage system transcriptional activator
MRKLPPLRSLQAFEAVARHRSFRAAAAELNVTSTALSHQIRSLEEACGKRLFVRRPRPIRLTAEGQLLYPALRSGFEAFAAAISMVMHMSSATPLRVTCPNAFASRWLVPRLPRWHDAHPDLLLQIIGTDAVLDLVAGEVDIAIRYARTAPKGVLSEEIGRDAFFPVASPALLADATRKPLTADDLLRFPLIHYEWTNADPRAPSWSHWFAAAGVTAAGPAPLRIRRELSFREELHAIDAALAGLGVALCSDIVLEQPLRDGALVKVHPFALPGYGFYVAHHANHSRADEARTFAEWLVSCFGSRHPPNLMRNLHLSGSGDR